jgi:hypothetical protein
MVSPMRRWVLMVAIVGVAVAIAAASYGLRDGDPRVTATVPDVARITCEPDAVRLDATSVRARVDGVHVAVANLSRALYLDFTSADGESTERLPLTPGLLERATFALPPGRVSVECVAGREMGRPRRPAALLVVDPLRLWVSPSLACEETVTMDYEVDLAVAGEDAAATFRRSMPGLLSTDELLKPGYPRTAWHGDLLIVVRESETVARATRAESEGRWDVSVDACPGVGLTDP